MRKTLCLAVIITWTVFSFAQLETATLTGRVTDPSGALIAGAQVVVQNMDTNVEVRTTTNGAGIYVVPNLHPARYRVSAGAKGFRTLIKTDLVLHVQEEMSENFSLGVGSATESVTVTAESSLVNTESGAVGTVVDRQFVENLPLNGRSFQTLINLTPGVTLAAGAAGANVTGQFSVNGQRTNSNAFTIDGVSANFGTSPGGIIGNNSAGNLPGFTLLGTTQSMVSVDALQEFKVQTSTYAAENGRQPGGQISMVTRSGTNQYHGTAFDYFRNEAMDANDWFANRLGQARPPERQNDFGGVLGGPIVIPHIYNGRNRTFFFFSYEGLRLTIPTFGTTSVPSLCLRGLGSCSGPLDTPAVAAMLPILNAFPLPNGPEEFTTVGGTTPNGLAPFSLAYGNPSLLDAASIRIDHTVNNKLTIFGRYNHAPSSSVARVGNNLGRTNGNYVETQTLTLGATSAFNSRMTNELRANYTNNPAFAAAAADNLNGAVPPDRSLLILPQFDSPYSSTAVNFGSPYPGSIGTLPLLSLPSNNLSNSRSYNIVDTLAYQHGAHQFKFGVDYRRGTPVNSVNTYTTQATFTGLASLKTGVAPGASFVIATAQLRPIFLNYSLFGEDTWKVSRRLTLNLGLRWDVNPAAGEASGKIPQNAVNEIDNFATMTLQPPGTPMYATTYKNFAPRVGVAYQLRQASGHETVLRGGWGIFYDTGNDLDANGKFPWAINKPVTNWSYPLNVVQQTPPTLPGPVTFPIAISTFDPHLQLPYTLQWNVAAEQGLGRNQTLSVTYVGAAGRRLLSSNFQSLSAKGLSTLFTTANITRSIGSSDYDALQAQFTRRLSHGLQVVASYTWAHSMDNDSGDATGAPPARGNSNFDVRQVFGAAATYDIPSPANAVLRGVLGHWSMDTNVHAQSALPLTLISTIFVAADGSNQQIYPNLIPGVEVYANDPTVPGGRTFNSTVPTAAQVAAAGCVPLSPAPPATPTNAKGAFCTPPAGVQGNAGRGQFRGLSNYQIDYAIRRQFKLTERLSLQFRAEAFNVLNHPNFGATSLGLSSANFGQATNMLGRQLGGVNPLFQIGGPRSLQLALKLQF